MKKLFSILGSIIFLAILLLPLFHPILTAVAEESQPKLLTVSHNGKKVTADQEIEAGDNDTIQIKATGDFTLKIPKSEGYEIGLLPEEEQQEIKSKSKETENLSFAVTAAEEGYEIQLEKDMTVYFKLNLLAESATLRGTASFKEVNLPETQINLIHLVKPAATIESSAPQPEETTSSAEENQEANEKLQESQESSSAAEVTTESSEEIKEVVFYKDDKKLDDKTKLTVEEGEAFNPSENVTAKSVDGATEYPVKAVVKKEGKKISLSDGSFIPKLETNYHVEYQAVEKKTNETIATQSIGLLVSNGSLDVSLEWVTNDAAQQTHLTHIVSQTNGLRLLTYKLNIVTETKNYKKGEIKITLPANSMNFSNSTGLNKFRQWSQTNISLAPIGQSTDIFAYEKAPDGSLIITNQKDINETIHQSFELSMLFSANEDGSNQGYVRARQIYHGTNASMAFNVEDSSQTEPAKKNFKTNSIKLTLNTSYAQPTMNKFSTPFNPYEWKAEDIGHNRPDNFYNYRWIKFDITHMGGTVNGKNLVMNFTDQFAFERGSTKRNLTKAEVDSLKIFPYYAVNNNRQYFVTEGNAGLDSRTTSSSGQIKWTSKTNRNHTDFIGTNTQYGEGSNDQHHFYFVVGFPKNKFETTDKIHNTITSEYRDGDTNTWYSTDTKTTVATLSEYSFEYPPGDLTSSRKIFAHRSYDTWDPTYSIYGSTSGSTSLKKELVIPVLKAGNDVTIHTAKATYSANQSKAGGIFSFELTDDHAKWKTGGTSPVDMKAEDFYFSQMRIQTQTLLPNAAKNWTQQDGVKLPYLKIMYQDDDSGNWKEHSQLIAPKVYPNAGTNPDGTKYDKYGWGAARSGETNSGVYGVFDLVKDYGIKPYRLRMVTVDKAGNKTKSDGAVGQVTVNVQYDMTIRGIDTTDNKVTQLESWNNNNQLDSLTIHNFTGWKVEGYYSSTGKYTHYNPDHNTANDRFTQDVKEYGDYLERREANHTITTEPEKSFMDKQVVHQSNDPGNKSNLVNWKINWAEGYDIGLTDLDEIRQMFTNGQLKVPERKMIRFTDLLPAGHTYESASVYYRGKWLVEDEDYTVTLTENYGNTGRTLVRFQIDPSSVTNKSGYLSEKGITTNRKGIRGNTLSVNLITRIAWADRFLANENATSSNRNSATIQLFNQNYTPEAMLGDAKTGTAANTEIKSELNNSNASHASPGTITKNSLNAYEAVEITGETSVENGLSKFVKADEEGAIFDISGTGKFSPTGNYFYRLDYRTEASVEENYVKNVVLFDQLEQVNTNQQGYSQGWKGILVDVDTSYARSKGIDAKIYVNNNLITPFKPGGGSLNSASGWKLFTSSMSEADRKNIKTIAVDLTKTTTGVDKQFKNNEYINITFKMKMPENMPSLPKAYNVPWLSSTRVTSGNAVSDVTEGVYTDFQLYRNPDLTIVKQDLENPSTKLDGVKFELEYPDGTKKDYTTNNLGQIKVTDLEPGKYKLREKSTKFGYELLAGVYEFTVNDDRTVTHPKDTNHWKYSFSENTISLNVYNRKKFILPITGGTGAAISLLLIVAIAVIAGLGWYLKRYRFTA
ncbi:SpaA isopeptide-forming pilin-related protein [Enterococcus pallens]|uniref:SpaA-like prealbumin fold domain-containing protein n=2 Tax=Enterococcus pallens TaxID=160454 RepID=R2QFE0_9ENTE|nr:SpaA isopeptide-forming pilin-related protein [Enterococcus pallens]EOH95227.1 hypothetical protein UAU_01189 [Enterococcus pallens ATCC BAA-351]EOU21636.1 hypothetical protein I588_02483 [Enterococcus pallens ATCC BAA-351]OJG77743.1 hypothetical protein RV10_GL002274 [Enterococcus pallens]